MFKGLSYCEVKLASLNYNFPYRVIIPNYYIYTFNALHL